MFIKELNHEFHSQITFAKDKINDDVQFVVRYFVIQFSK